MPSDALELQIEPGRTFELHLSYQPGGVVADLSSNISYVQARINADDTTAVFSFDTGADTEIENGSWSFDGQAYNIKIKIPPAATLLYAVGSCFMQVWTQDAAGDRFGVLPSTLLQIAQPVIVIS